MRRNSYTTGEVNSGWRYEEGCSGDFGRHALYSGERGNVTAVLLDMTAATGGRGGLRMVAARRTAVGSTESVGRADGNHVGCLQAECDQRKKSDPK